MNIIVIILAIFITLNVLLIIVCGYELWRNERVFQFRKELVNQSYEAAVHYIHAGQLDKSRLVDVLTEKHSYDAMLFSFKPLKLRCWFTEEEISLLYPKPNNIP